MKIMICQTYSNNIKKKQTKIWKTEWEGRYGKGRSGKYIKIKRKERRFGKQDEKEDLENIFK